MKCLEESVTRVKHHLLISAIFYEETAIDTRFQIMSVNKKKLETLAEGFFFDGGRRILGRWVIKLGS